MDKVISSELLKAAKNIPDNIYKLGALDQVTMGQSSNTFNKLESVHKAFSFSPKQELINSITFSGVTNKSSSLQCLLGGYFRNVPVKRFENLNEFELYVHTMSWNG